MVSLWVSMSPNGFLTVPYGSLWGSYGSRHLEGLQHLLAERLPAAADPHVGVELRQSGQRCLGPIAPHIVLPQVKLGPKTADLGQMRPKGADLGLGGGEKGRKRG